MLPTAPLKLSGQSARTADSPDQLFHPKSDSRRPASLASAAGLVDESALPAAAVQSAVDYIMSDPARAKAALQYGSTQGMPTLRRQCLERVLKADSATAEELNVDESCVVITTGSQQMLYLLGETLFDVGDIVICEAPS